MASIISSPSDDISGSMPSKAGQACAACRKQKRRCDKAVPTCGLCARMGRLCDYSDVTPPPSSDDFQMLRQKVHDLEQKLLLSPQNSGSTSMSPLSSNTLNGSAANTQMMDGGMNGMAVGPVTKSSFPVMFFLDATSFEEQRRTVPKASMPVPPEVLAHLGSSGDIQHIVGTYFLTVHTWLPMVSKKRMYSLLSNPNVEPGADHALLFLCMKLVAERPPDNMEPAEAPLYWTAKNFFSMVEASAILTTQLVQASVLISTYEMGHGIYPAAFLTAGHSARLGQAIGMHSRRESPQVHKRPPTWTEQEEIRRVWWAVMIVDRFVNIGSWGHPLASDGPSRNDVLPSDDAPWDQGEMVTSEPIFVQSATNVKAGPFARTCQAAHLVGRVVQHKNDRSLDSPFRFSEAAQLHRTISALTTLLPSEFEHAPERLGTAMALCYSAMLSLYDPYSCTESNRGEHTVEETEMQAIAINGLQTTADEVLRFAQLLKRTMTYDLAAISPLIADCLYGAASTYAWLAQERGTPEMVASYNSLVEALKLMEMRWKVAGEYIKMLETSDYAHPEQSTQPTAQPYP